MELLEKIYIKRRCSLVCGLIEILQIVFYHLESFLRIKYNNKIITKTCLNFKNHKVNGIWCPQIMIPARFILIFFGVI